MTRAVRIRRRAALRRAVAAVVVVSAGLVPLGTGTPVAAAPAAINGAGSTYAALAMQQWTAEAQADGLRVNYTPSGSPDGLGRFNGNNIDYAGTEAEFASLSVGDNVARGYQYVPDVAGAIAVMYNVDDRAGRKVDYLHLSRQTVARIYTGDISRWSDPAITNDNRSHRLPNGLKLPDEPINVVYRGGQSGTTALFYDFIANTDPGLFSRWARRNGLPTDRRIIQLDSAPNFAPKTQALSGSDQIAQYVAGGQGKWSIAYDEFGYAKTYGASSAWIQNAAGRWVLPYAENISAALVTADLREDLSQELSGVYASRDPKAYPISAYSYIVTQCANGFRTCRGPYPNTGITETLARWMRYIACRGQTQMARIGYSPLPPNLSQEIVNSIGRLQGRPTGERLNSGNCENPRFRGSLGPGSASPQDPLFTPGGEVPGGSSGGGTGEAQDPGAPGADGAGGPGGPGAGPGANGAPGAGAGAGNGAGAGAGGNATTTTDPAAAGDSGDEVAAGRAGTEQAVGGGSGLSRPAAPTAYRRGAIGGDSRWPLIVLLAAIAVPPLAATAWRRARRPAT